MYDEIRDIDQDQLLRDVNLDGFRLVIWDTYQTDRYGKSQLGYLFYDRNGSVLFWAEDYYCSACHSIDSDDSVRGLISFLVLKPGDIEPEYFEDYTQDQLDFAETDAEMLSEYSFEPGDFGDDYKPPKLIDWEK